MDLIFADKNKFDIGVLKDYSFDLAFGEDENDFELTVSIDNNVCEEDYFVYIEGTEYGGIIDAIEVVTASKTLKYKGRTWHGLLNSKIIQPDSGDDYYVVSGDANTILSTLITRLSLGSLFVADTSSSGITYTNYQFPRYISAYDAIRGMLQSKDAKLHVEFTDGYVVLSALPIVDYTSDELDSDHVGFKILRTYNPVNHLICLGKGELHNRTVINLYCDASGNVSTTQTFTGIEEYTDVFDYPNAESAAQLQADGTEKLKELNGADKVDVSLDAAYSFDIGDLIEAEEVVTGISVTRRVVKKIVTINKDQFLVNYTVGE